MLELLLTVNLAFSGQVKQVKSHINTLVNNREVSQKRTIAEAVVKYSKEYNIKKKVLLAILMTESSMRVGAKSNTGDYYVGQVNYKTWSREFLRLGREPLEFLRLTHDVDYCIKRTAEILSILKRPKDPHWIGKYHSNTPELKYAYYVRVNKHIEKLLDNW